jgi:hypothetical protein
MVGKKFRLKSRPAETENPQITNLRQKRHPRVAAAPSSFQNFPSKNDSNFERQRHLRSALFYLADIRLRVSCPKNIWSTKSLKIGLSTDSKFTKRQGHLGFSQTMCRTKWPNIFLPNVCYSNDCCSNDSRSNV